MKLIVGLGNPGKKYQDTRHNIGWQVLTELAQRHGISKPRAKFEGEVIETQFGTEKGLLLCPMTYMNASGRSVRPAVGTSRRNCTEGRQLSRGDGYRRRRLGPCDGEQRVQRLRLRDKQGLDALVCA